MDVKYLNPFLDAIQGVMPQLGFTDIKKANLNVKDKSVKTSGVMLNLGIVGDIKGNVIYTMTFENAKQIASKMMMGMEVPELNEMAQSALSELSNMLTANASIKFSEMGINIDISTPTLIYGEDIEAKTNVDKVICITMSVDGIGFDVNIAIH